MGLICLPLNSKLSVCILGLMVVENTCTKTLCPSLSFCKKGSHGNVNQLKSLAFEVHFPGLEIY